MYKISNALSLVVALKSIGCLCFCALSIAILIFDQQCQLSSSIIALLGNPARMQLPRRHVDGWRRFRSLRNRGIGLCCLLTIGYPAKRAEAFLYLFLLPEKRESHAWAHTRGFPRRYPLAKEDYLLWRVGNDIGKWGKKTEEARSSAFQNFHLHKISIIYLEKKIFW